MQLQGKTALVTGSGRGIGQGCALALARAGADVVINDRPDSADGEAAAAEIRALGRRSVFVPVDALTRSGCESLFDQATEALGPIDILVSNVAVSIRNDFLSYDPDEFELVVQGTLTAGFHISQLVAKQMVERGRGGKIVFISSVHALTPYARSCAYNAAKAGLNHLANTIAIELAEHRINVNTIEPGATDTPGERIKFGEEFLRQFGEKLPLGRMGTSDDIGRAALFLCSPDADYITGAVLRVDGGYWLKDAR